MQPDTIRTALTPVVADIGCSLYDVEFAGSGKARTLRVLVDRPGGVDLDVVTTVTRRVSQTLDTMDPVGGSYTLEVGSPGLERPLRRPEHFVAAVSETVSVKYRDEHGAVQRVSGPLRHAGPDRCTVGADGDECDIAYEQVIAAHTVFAWGAAETGPGATKSGKRRNATNEHALPGPRSTSRATSR